MPAAASALSSLPTLENVEGQPPFSLTTSWPYSEHQLTVSKCRVIRAWQIVACENAVGMHGKHRCKFSVVFGAAGEHAIDMHGKHKCTLSAVYSAAFENAIDMHGEHNRTLSAVFGAATPPRCAR